MGFSFNGILSADEPKLPLPDDTYELVVRLIEHNDLKVGALFPELQIGFDGLHSATNSQIEFLIAFGVTSGVLIEYHTWAGTIDGGRIVQVLDSRILKETYREFEEMDYRSFSAVLSDFNIDIDESGEFQPFSRGFWGEHGD